VTSTAGIPNGKKASREGLESAGTILEQSFTDLRISKRRLRQVENIQMVRQQRETAQQRLAFASRPFVLCGLSIRRPQYSGLVHERWN
jgi:hypothetical protein